MSRTDLSVMSLQRLRSISRSNGHDWARADTESSVISSTPLSLTRRRSGHLLARASIPISETFLHPPRLMPCSRFAADARPTIAVSVHSTTPVRSIATRLGKQGRTRVNGLSEMAAQLTNVRRSSLSHCAKRENSESVSSPPRKRKFNRRIKRAYVNV